MRWAAPDLDADGPPGIVIKLLRVDPAVQTPGVETVCTCHGQPVVEQPRARWPRLGLDKYGPSVKLHGCR